MKKKPTIYYKVIRSRSRNSALIESRKFKVKYPVDEWVYPKVDGSKLMVFSNRDIAEQWCSPWRYGHCQRTISDLIVVPCLIKNPSRANLLKTRNIFGRRSTRFMEIFWENWDRLRKLRKNKRDEIVYCDPAVYGAIYASAVKCLE